MTLPASLTLLIDLDDTLLGNHVEDFLPSYLRALAQRMSDHAEPQFLIQTLLAATRAMVKNRQPDRTLEQTFDAAFYPVLGIDKETARPALDAFYAEDFPRLKSLTRPIPEAASFIETVHERGWRTAIATNPLFPLTAIQQRLQWAGFPAEKHYFSLIASLETFHFTKPHPAYYHECLARLGWPEGGVIVVGDDPENDIAAARRAGLAVFQVGQSAQGWQGDGGPAYGRGGLADFLPWVDQLPEEAALPNFSAPEAALATLRSTPALLSSFSDWDWPRKAGEWGPGEIFCHLRDVDSEVYFPRLHKFLSEENPFLPGQDTDRWAEERRYAAQDGALALQNFIGCRKELLALLDALTPEEWERPARHAIFGPTTLKEIIAIAASHDRLHIRQLSQSA